MYILYFSDRWNLNAYTNTNKLVCDFKLRCSQPSCSSEIVYSRTVLCDYNIICISTPIIYIIQIYDTALPRLLGNLNYKPKSYQRQCLYQLELITFYNLLSLVNKYI